MSKQANPIAIGGFVLGALALVVAALLVFGSGAWFRETIPAVTHFPGTVKGLQVGARVDFEGVQVGQVTGIKLDYWPKEKRFAVPVYYELWPDSLRTYGVGTPESDGQQMPHGKALVEDYGLRAQLDPVSLVTGQYMIALSLLPGSRYEYLNKEPERLEIPAVEAARDRLLGMFQELDLMALVTTATNTLNNIDALLADPNVRGLASTANRVLADTQSLLKRLADAIEPTVARVDATLGEYAVLARTASGRLDGVAARIEEAASATTTLSGAINDAVKPATRSAAGAFEQARKTFESIDAIVAAESSTRSNLDSLLDEAARAARSLRLLADFLEQNPDALIKGKY